mgnify:CR=1 FL=1
MCNLTDCVMNSISIVNHFSVRPMQFEGIIGRFYNNFADFITQASFSPCFPLFPYRLSGRPSEMRLETFSPQRRVILYWSIQTSSERMKTV